MSILSHLTERFSGADAITRVDFRTYLGISHSTDCRLKRLGHYPRTINVAGSERILLIDLAAWLEQGGAERPQQPLKRGPGRPKGSKNKPKEAPRTSPMLPASMAAAIGIHAS